MLGPSRGQGAGQLETHIDAKNAAQVGAWSAAAVYLCGRLHSSPEDRPPSNPNRAPDMSQPAAAAMKAVLKELAFAAASAASALSAPRWAALHRVASTEGGPLYHEKSGAAAAHAHVVREEAAKKLIANHELGTHSTPLLYIYIYSPTAPHAC